MSQIFNRAKARETSTITFVHVDGSEQGGVVGARPDCFSVVSHPRYGDTKPRLFAYTDVAEIISIEPRRPVHLAEFSRLMKGLS